MNTLIENERFNNWVIRRNRLQKQLGYCQQHLRNAIGNHKALNGLVSDECKQTAYYQMSKRMVDRKFKELQEHNMLASNVWKRKARRL